MQRYKICIFYKKNTTQPQQNIVETGKCVLCVLKSSKKKYIISKSCINRL